MLNSHSKAKKRMRACRTTRIKRRELDTAIMQGRVNMDKLELLYARKSSSRQKINKFLELSTRPDPTRRNFQKSGPDPTRPTVDPTHGSTRLVDISATQCELHRHLWRGASDVLCRLTWCTVNSQHTFNTRSRLVPK